MDITPVLPSQQNLPDFTDFRTTRKFVTNDGHLKITGSADGRTHVQMPFHVDTRVEAIRCSDGAQLKVEVSVYLNEQLATEWFHKQPVRAMAIPVEKVPGTRSGKSISHESFHKKSGSLVRIPYTPEGDASTDFTTHLLIGKPTLPQSGYKIYTRRGQVVVKVHLIIGEQCDSAGNIIRGEDGRPKQDKLSDMDITFVEDLAASTLDKLDDLGYTRKP